MYVLWIACDGRKDRRTDRQMDGRIELRSKDRASIAASRGNNHSTLVWAPDRGDPLQISSSNLAGKALGYICVKLHEPNLSRFVTIAYTRVTNDDRQTDRRQYLMK